MVHGSCVVVRYVFSSAKSRSHEQAYYFSVVATLLLKVYRIPRVLTLAALD